MLEKAHVEKRVLSWVDGETELDTLDSLIEGERDDSPLPVPEGHSRIIILTSGTTGTPKGAPAQRGRHRRRDLAALADAAEVRLEGAHRRAAVPHLGLRAPDALAAAGPHDRAAAQVRPRGRARPGRRPAVRRDGRDPGDAAADARAARREARRAQPRDGQGGRRLGLGAARRPRAQLDGPLRRQPLQHLRLDRGRLRVDRHPRGHAPGADHGGQAALGDRREDLRRRGHGAAAGRVGPDLRGQQPAVRGLHRRRPEGHDRRPDVVRRRGPLRRARAPLRRGPRRRDDRLRRRERLPQGGRGLPGPPRRGGRGGRARRGRRRLRQAAARVRGPAGRRVRQRGRPQGAREGQPRPLQGAARDRGARRAAAQRDRQGAQARAARVRRRRQPGLRGGGQSTE